MKSGQILWRCRGTRCYEKVKTSASYYINEFRGHHTCEPNRSKCATELILSNMRKRARLETTPVPQLNEEERRKALSMGAPIEDIMQSLP